MTHYLSINTREHSPGTVVDVKTMKECGNMETRKTWKHGKCGNMESTDGGNADCGNVDRCGFNLCVVPLLRNLVSVISELRKDFRR